MQFVAWSVRADSFVESSLYRARLRAEQQLAESGIAGAAIVSLSTRTVVYKALVAPADLARFYCDLGDARFATSFVVFHQRFSTNTFPDWSMAQPFHTLAHNGEINTIVGNRLKAARRQADTANLPELAGLDIPAVCLQGSDSRSLDDQVALLVGGGLSLPHAIARVVRRAWEQDRTLTADERAFEQYQSCVGDSWEGPAALAMSDGRYVGLAVDRSGFRPARILESSTGLIVAGSETGIVDVRDSDILSRGRVGPGQMFFLDLDHGQVFDDRVLRASLAQAQPYRQLVAQSVTTLPSVRSVRGRHESTGTHAGPSLTPADLRRTHRQFAYTAEELDLILRPMFEHGTEAVGSMAALGTRARLLPDFFRQRFAQVTNPPLDPLREKAVMSLRTLFGCQGRLLDETAPDARMTAAESPILSNRQLAASSKLGNRPATTVGIVFDAAGGAEGMRQALHQVVDESCSAVRNGTAVVILSDRRVSATHAPIPALLATAAVHHALGRAGLGTRAAIVADTGEARDAHQTATLLAFGAAAVCPWLGYLTALSLCARVETSPRLALDQYRAALEQGLLKILSKMGVCTIDAYRGSQLFEIVGLDATFAEQYFPATALVRGSLSFDRLAIEVCERHMEAARVTIAALPHPGFHGFRRDGDHHMFNPALVKAFHHASSTGSPEAYGHFTTLLHARPATAVRDLLTFAAQPPVPIEEVEPAESIWTRFFASAMSVGALGPEAHRTLAIALNRLGGRSNSGEGGEDAQRYARDCDGTWANSVTKQIASARFGVTPAYLASARELQIKMAQGSK
ncbi:MAG: glutamate synthase-related protein, partial [Planctomycetota bacterium]|nr:glutamate synthase-related protein [Planctomycetota bacterium]